MEKYFLNVRITLSREDTYQSQQDVEITNEGVLDALYQMCYGLGEMVGTGAAKLVDMEMVARKAAAAETPEE